MKTNVRLLLQKYIYTQSHLARDVIPDFYDKCDQALRCNLKDISQQLLYKPWYIVSEIVSGSTIYLVSVDLKLTVV